MNKISIHPRKPSYGELAQAKRQAAYEAQKAVKRPVKYRSDWRGHVVISAPRGSTGEVIGWSGDNV